MKWYKAYIVIHKQNLISDKYYVITFIIMMSFSQFSNFCKISQFYPNSENSVSYYSLYLLEISISSTIFLTYEK